MLTWITENPVIFAAICTVVGVIISSATAIHIERKKGLNKIIVKMENKNTKLSEENLSLKEELEKFRSVEEREKTIDKSKGSAYLETLSNNQAREICGFCWETSKKTVPVDTFPDDSDYDRDPFHDYGRCKVCGTSCRIENGFDPMES